MAVAQSHTAASGAKPPLIPRDMIVKWAPLMVLLVLVAFFAIMEPRFFSVRNFARIGISSAPALMVAIGVTFIILMGSIDLSMEGTVSVSAVLFAFAFLAWGGTLASWAWLSIPMALIVGAMIGFINGLIHVRLRIPSFMASLAMGFVGTGFALLLTGGDRIRIEDELFRSLLTVRWFNFPIMCYVALGMVLVAWFIQSRTTLGRNFYAVGGGEEL
ncbi:MAG: ABC transporter permease, partial [Pseudomonadota bacterium]